MAKATFKQIPEEKQERILNSAATLFAERGYYQTDVAQIASRAGVAKGSLYNYFESKEDIYIHVCRDGLRRFRQATYGGIRDHWDVYRQIAHVFRAGAGFAGQHPEYIRLYLNVSSTGMDRFAEELSPETERYFADHFKKLLRESKDKGDVRPGLDVNLTAFLINGLFMMFVASFVSRQFQIRMKEYLEASDEILGNPDALTGYLDRIIDMIRDWLKPEA